MLEGEARGRRGDVYIVHIRYTSRGVRRQILSSLSLSLMPVEVKVGPLPRLTCPDYVSCRVDGRTGAGYDNRVGGGRDFSPASHVHASGGPASSFYFSVRIHVIHKHIPSRNFIHTHILRTITCYA